MVSTMLKIIWPLMILLFGFAWQVGVLASERGQAACDRSGFRVALDSGHGPTRSGATSARGKTEASFNARLTKETLGGLKRAGFTAAFQVNEGGSDMPLKERTRHAATMKADLFVSIHHDSVQEHYLKPWIYSGKQGRFFDGFSGYSLFINMAGQYGPASRYFGEALGRALKREGLLPTLHHAEKIPGEKRPKRGPL